ncbi:hypothetical protein F5884DRAFT_457308 [Xylogone sp. PMI_703]|nr:hypothetical protein F5884DRAFT_457308 [Xylogone sp. PMI_703]
MIKYHDTSSATFNSLQKPRSNLKRVMTEKYHLVRLPQSSWYNVLVHRVKIMWYRYNITFGGYVMTPNERMAWNFMFAIVLACFVWTAFFISQALIGVGRNTFRFLLKWALEDFCLETAEPSCVGMEYQIQSVVSGAISGNPLNCWIRLN